MNKIIGVTELQRNFRAVFDQVVDEQASVILTRGSRPEAAMIPYDQYVKFIQKHEEDVHARFDAMLARMAAHNANYTDEEVERDVEEVSKIVRARRRRREKKQLYRPPKSGSATARKPKK